ncbi:MAG: GAF domain-containing protein [Chloroflexi bacterium]|nr:GAF domain-containing protein [Chloroflexota bacterium]
MVIKALKDHPKRSERLLEITQQLSATLELPKLLQSIVDAAAELTDSEQASIAQYFPEEDALRFIAAHWMDADLMETMLIPLDSSITGQAFKKKAPISVADAQNNPLFFRSVDDASGFNTNSMLAVPMSIRGQTTGVLSALNKKQGANYNEDDVAVLETLSSQAAIALHNSNLLRETREAYAHLAELDDMKNSFISITSHRLRIPLGLILGHATILKESVSGETLEQIEVIERNALRLKDVVEDLSQIETLQNHPIDLQLAEFDIAALMRKTTENAQGRASEKGVTLVANLPSEPIQIEGEADKLHVVIGHLLKNAIAFTPAEGRVELSLEEAGGWAVLRVADTGIGIQAKDLEHIFERFYQAEAHMTRRHGGMGLGLSIAKMMVELHGGSISVESVEGQGSLFVVRLPKRQK